MRVWRFRGYESQKFADFSIGEFAQADVCKFEKLDGQKLENFDIGKFDRSNVRKLKSLEYLETLLVLWLCLSMINMETE